MTTETTSIFDLKVVITQKMPPMDYAFQVVILRDADGIYRWRGVDQLLPCNCRLVATALIGCISHNDAVTAKYLVFNDLGYAMLIHRLLHGEGSFEAGHVGVAYGEFGRPCAAQFGRE